MRKTILGSLSAAVVIAFLPACSLKAPSKTTTIRIEVPKQKDGLALSGDPSAIADFSCYGVNVTGSGILPPVQVANGKSFGGCVQPGYPGLGIVGGLVAPSGGYIDVTVPMGVGRVIQVFGIRSQAGCPTIKDVFERKLDLEQLDNPYELGRATLDIMSDTSVTVNISYSASTPKKMFCDTRTGFGADPANSTITGTGPVVADGVSTSTVTITLKDSSNNPMVGTVPTFDATNTGSGNTYSACSATDSTGVSTCTLKSTKAETKTLRITSPLTKTDGTVVFNPGPADHLTFSAEPGTTASGVAFASQPVVKIWDQNNNLVTTGTDSTLSVNLSLTSGNGTLTGGATSMNAVAGVATFTNLSIDLSGAKILRATSGAMSVDTASFTITNGPATAVVITTQPVGFTAGGTLTTTVEIRDAFGNVVTTGPDATAALTVTLQTGIGPLTGTLTGAASSGTKTFTGLGLTTTQISSMIRVTKADTSGSGGTPVLTVDSTPFNVTHAAADHLTFTTQPASTTAGTPFGPQPIIEIRDQYENVVTTGTDAVTNIILSRPGGTTTLNGTLTVAAVGGVADFSGANVSVPEAGNWQILATKSVAATGTLTELSANFTITPNVPTALQWVQQPTTVRHSETMTPPPQIRIVDGFGNQTTGTDNVTLTISTNPGGASATGASVAAVAGVATFSAFSLNKPGTGYILSATSGGLTAPPPSSSFNILGVDLEVPIKMTDHPISSVTGAPMLFTRTMTSWDPNAYDGTGNQYFLDIVASNMDGTSKTVELVNDSNTPVGSIAVLSSPTPTRYRTSFSPGGAVTTLRLRLQNTTNADELVVYSAVIVVRQIQATRTRLYIPLLAGDSTQFSNLDTVALDSTTSTSHVQGTPVRYIGWLKDAAKYGNPTGSPWALEAVVSNSLGGQSTDVALYNRTSGNLVTIASALGTVPTIVASAAFSSAAAEFTDGQTFELRFKSSSGTNTANVHKAGVWVTLPLLRRGEVYFPIGANRPSATTFNETKQLTLLDPTGFTSPTAYFEANVAGNSVTGDLKLLSVGTSETAGGFGAVGGSTLTIPASGLNRLRSGALSLTAGDRYVHGLTTSAGTASITNSHVIIEFGAP